MGPMSEPRRHATLGGLRTAFLERGDGPAVVFVHGVGLDADMWADQLAAFGAGNRAIAYDTYGHGGSDAPPAGSDLGIYVEQLRALLDALGIERAVVVGHSMGALIATGLAVEHPGRVAGLVAFNAVYRRSADARASALDRAAALERDGPASTVDAAIARWFGDPVPDGDTRMAGEVRRSLLSADPVGYARAYRVFAESDDRYDGRLGAISAPALFVTGQDDPHSTPAMSEAMAADAPHGRAVVLPGERHMIILQNPGKASELIRTMLDETARAVPPRIEV